jgi:hypothetical protein
MGSRIMHYCITSLLSQSLKLTDDSFFLGGLAPDVNRYMGHSHYYLTHFAKLNAFSQPITDYAYYIATYLSDHPSPFHLGYYFHLLSDDVWKEDIYYKKIKSLPHEEKRVALEKNYRDFWRLNGRIIDHFSLELRELDPPGISMPEIDSTYLPELIMELHRDFALKDEASGEDLEFLDFDEVLGVIEKSVKVCLDAYGKLIGEDIPRTRCDLKEGTE